MRGDLQYRRLDSLADVAGGVALGGAVSGGSTVELPYLRVANVQDGYISTDVVKTLRVSAASVERFRLKRGDVLLTEGGDFDKLGRGAVWDGRIDPCLHQNHVFRVRCFESQLLPEFLALYMASPEGRAYFLRIAKQTTNLATISSSQLKAMPVPYLPVGDQRRIVEAIDAVSAQERVIEASIAKLSSMRQGIVQRLVERIEHGEGGATWVPVGEVGTVRTGKQLSPDSKAAGQQFPYLRVANVLDGWIDFSDVKTMGFTEAERSVYGIKSGDVLLNEGQSLELVGRSSVYRGRDGEYCFQNTLVRFRAGRRVLPEYAQSVFEYWLHSGVFAGIAKKTTSIAHLGGDRFAMLEFPLISIDAQRNFLDAVTACRESMCTKKQELVKIGLVKRGLVNDLLNGAG